MAARIGSSQFLPVVELLLAVAIVVVHASAQVDSNNSRVSINLAIQQWISVSVGLCTVDFSLLAGDVANGDNPIPVTTG